MARFSSPRLLLSVLLLATVSCSTSDALVSQQVELGTAMNQCLANQEKSAALLAQQRGQIDGMVSSLALIQQDLVEIDRKHAPPEVEQFTVPACSPVETIAVPIDGSAKMLVGQLEQVWLQNLELALPARIDTGAETASLDAREIELFERNSEKWVRFEIVHPQRGEPIQLERKLTRMALIVQASSSEPERRPVIKLGITLGHISQSAEFTLSNRSHLDYQMLIGRNILQDVMIVDVSKQDIAPHTLSQATIGPDTNTP